MAARILVINDTQEILDLFQDLLGEEGYDVVLFAYAPQEMHEIERIAPDLIILDYIFGNEKTGWQTLQKLKMRRTTASIPVIICTAAIREVRDIEGFLDAKGVKVVPKPFDIDDLLNAVKSGLAARTSAAGLRKFESEESDTSGKPNGPNKPDKPETPKI